MAKPSKNAMGWYTVRVLLKATGKGQPVQFPLCEHRLILVRARNHVDAEKKAKRIAQTGETPYKNSFGNTVRWKVSHIYESVHLFEDEFPLDGPPTDGAQVYWRFIYSRDPVKRLKREVTMNGIG